jgi:hypothetical protein
VGSELIIKWKGKDIDDLHNKLARFAVYDDITTDVVDTGLWKDLVLKLSEAIDFKAEKISKQKRFQSTEDSKAEKNLLKSI